jgi:hypothetical protein
LLAEGELGIAVEGEEDLLGSLQSAGLATWRTTPLPISAQA